METPTVEQLHKFRSRIHASFRADDPRIFYVPFDPIEVGRMIQVFEEETGITCKDEKEFLLALKRRNALITGTDPGRGIEITLPTLQPVSK